MSHLVAVEYKCFEDIRRIRPDGSEYWYARELASVLDYAKWENFAKVIKRAMIACENSGKPSMAALTTGSVNLGGDMAIALRTAVDDDGGGAQERADAGKRKH